MKAFPRLRRRSIVMLLLVLVFILALSGRTGSTTQVHAANTSIVQQSSAHPFALKGISSPNENVLQAVSVVSATDIWAVGSYFKPGPTYQTLTEHWNGTNWSIVPSPKFGHSENDLFGVSTVSATDVWSVGVYLNNNLNVRTLVEHWNGTSWNVVPSPNPGTGLRNDELQNVAVVSATDVWAVGSDSGSALFEHWNGTQWSVVPSPNGTGFNSLSALTVVSATDIWAVGNYFNSNNLDQTLIEQWNGTSWNIVPSPNVGSTSNTLTSVAEVSANDVWTVGFFGASLPTSQTLIEHWNGTQWSDVPSPNHK